jgi:CRP-like cAMP-binding protein
MTMTTIERVVALQRVNLFADIPGRTLAAVARRAIESHVEAGTLVIVEGAVEDHLFTVVDGQLRIHRGDLEVTTVGAGSTVGELAALVPEPRVASVTAVVPTTLLRIDKAVLDELLADRPALAGGIITALVAMVRERVRTQADLTRP